MNFILLNIFDTFNELGFVVKIMVFAYLLYWLFIVFREQQVLLGLVAIIAAYFMFFHSISLTLLVLVFFVFVVMSGHFQFLIDFGLIPILSMFGFHEAHGSEELKMQEVQKKMMEGQSLSQEEATMFRESQEKNARYEAAAHRLLAGGAQH